MCVQFIVQQHTQRLFSSTATQPAIMFLSKWNRQVGGQMISLDDVFLSSASDCNLFSRPWERLRCQDGCDRRTRFGILLCNLHSINVLVLAVWQAFGKSVYYLLVRVLRLDPFVLAAMFSNDNLLEMYAAFEHHPKAHFPLVVMHC